MMKRNTLHFAAVALACLTLAAPAELPAQSGNSRNTQLSKRYWDLWRIGFESYEAGESALLAGRNEEAADCYRRALNAFQSVRKNNPNWNKNVINYRISLADRRLKTALRRLEFQRNGSSKDIAGDSDSGSTRELREKIKALQDSLAESERINLDLRKLAEQGKVARDQVVDLLKEKKELEKKYESLVLQYNEIKKSAATASADTSSLEKAFKKEQARTEALLKIVEELRKEGKELQAKLERTQENVEAEKQKLATANRKLVSAGKTEDLFKDLQKKYKRMEADLNEKLDTLKDQLKAEKNKLAAKTRENETLRDNQSAAAKKLAEETELLRDQAYALKKDIATLKKTVGEKNKLINEASNREMRLNSMVASLNERNKDSEARLKTTERTLAAEQDKVRQTEQKFAALNEENKDLKEKVKLLAERVNKIPVVTAAAEAEKLKAQQDIKRLTASLETSTKDLTTVKAELTSAHKELDTYRQKLEAAEKALADARKAGKEQQQKIAQLEADLATLKKDFNAKDEAAKLRISQLEKSITDFKVAAAGKDEASKLNVKLQELLDMTRKELAEQKAAAAGKDDAIKQSNQLQQQMAQLKKDIEAEKAAIQAAEQKKSAALQEQIKQLTARSKSLSAELQKVTAAQKATDEKLLAVQKEAAEKLAAAQTAAAEKLTAAQNAANTKFTEAQKTVNAKLAASEKTSADLRKSVQALTKERHILTEKNKKLSKDLLNTQALLEKARLQAQDDTKLRAAEKARDGWKEQTEQVNKKNAELGKNIQAEKEKLAKMKAAVAELEKKRDELNKKLQRTESELEGWKKNQNTVSKKELDTQVKATDTMAGELKAKIEEINKLKNKLVEADALTTRYRQNLQQARNITEKAMAESRKLRAELAMYRRNDPHAMPEVEKAQGMPKEIIALTTVPNDEKDRARKADASKFDSLMAKGKQFEDQKKYDDALWTYWAAADAGVNRPEPYMAISRIHAIRNNPEQGIKTYERALRLGGKRVPAIEQTLKKQLIDKKKKAQ